MRKWAKSWESLLKAEVNLRKMRKAVEACGSPEEDKGRGGVRKSHFIDSLLLSKRSFMYYLNGPYTTTQFGIKNRISKT